MTGESVGLTHRWEVGQKNLLGQMSRECPENLYEKIKAWDNKSGPTTFFGGTARGTKIDGRRWVRCINGLDRRIFRGHE